MIIYIFLNNKLISCDTIIPVCMEIKAQRPDADFVFYSESEAHHASITQNITLHKAINHLGRLEVFGALTAIPKSSVLRKVVIAFQILAVTLRCFMGKAYCFHFKKLNYFPYCFIKKFHKNKTVLFEGNGRGESALLTRGYNRPVEQFVLDDYLIVGFSRSWLDRLAKTSRHKQIQIPLSFSLPEWNKFLITEAEDLKLKEHWLAQKPINQPVVVFILGTLGTLQIMREEGSMIKCLRDSIRAVQAVSPEAQIVLKPHVITNLKLLTTIIEEFENANINIANLHPGLIGKFADVVICNAYSTAMADAYVGGAVTIEFTDYTAEMLAFTNGSTVEPRFIDHFINRDFNKLSKVLTQALVTRRSRQEPHHLVSPDLRLLTQFVKRFN